MADETRKLSLGIKDRLTLPVLFPERSNYIGQVLVEDISKKIRVDQADMKEIELKYSEPDKDGKQFMTWNRDKEKDLEIEFTQAEADFLKKQADRLDKTEQITAELTPLIRAIKGL